MSYLGRNKLFIAIVCLLVFIFTPGCDSYYVKVVDQNGSPISGAKIVYATHNGNAYFTGREGHYATTDQNGVAKMVYGNTNSFFELTKPGYQFDFTRQMKWRVGLLFGNNLKRYTKDNPLLIYGWRRGEQPDLVTVKDYITGYKEGEQCTITLLKASEFEELDQDIKLNFTVTGDWEKVTDEELLKINPIRRYKLKSWRATLEVPGAGIKETEDVFMHRADEDGYQPTVTMSPGYRHGFIHYFIRGPNGQYYGGAIINAQIPLPGSKTKLSDIEYERDRFRAEFWFNIEGSPDIMRPKDADWFAEGVPLRSAGFRCEEPPTSN